MTDQEKAREFQRRRNLPGVEVRYMFAGRTSDTVLTLCGRELGTKTTVTTRGKPDQVLYVLPELP